MSMMLYLLAAGAVNKSKSSNKGGFEKSSGRANKKISYYGLSYSPTDYILKELAYGESKEMNDFFTNLYSYGELLVKEHNDKLRDEILKENQQTSLKITPEVIKLKEKEMVIKSLGIDLGENYNFYCAEYYHDSKGNELFDGAINYFDSFNNLSSFNFVTEFDDNDENIRRSDIRFSDKKDKLNESEQKRKDMAIRKESLIKKLGNLEAMVKIPFGKKRRIDEIECIKKEISEIDEYLKNEYLKSKKIFDYEALTYEEKNAIIDYIKVVEKVKSLCYEYLKSSDNRRQFISDVHIKINYSYEKNEELWLRALYRMLNEENIDLEFIDKVFEQIRQSLIKGVNDEYNMHTRGWEDFSVEKYGQMVNFFIDNIYIYEDENILTQRISYSDICGNQFSKRK